MAFDISKMRNIGISAHIDSGKTTLSERILFYCRKIHAIHEVKGKDGVGATMDSMELERERGITIASAATNVTWGDHTINLIDTPGHVDFTIEVERSLRVLDGAVLVLCSVGGVQSQTLTVDRQLKRYNVPRLAFINKCDRTGANPYRVRNQVGEKLGLNAVMMTLPIGLEDKLEGLVDLVEMRAVYFDGDGGVDLRFAEIPAHMADDAASYREQLLDAASMFSDELAEAFLEGTETIAMIKTAIRKGTIALQLVPVFCGSAYKNKGVQLLLNGVVDYLPNPTEVKNIALDLDNNETAVETISEENKPTVALAFKLEDGQYGQLTYVRIYQGSVKKGDELINTRARRKFKVGRLVRMHAASMEDINEGTCGDIVALFGIECASGDTFCTPSINYAMTSMFVPDPVISLAIMPKDKKSADQMSKALNRFTKEDPTFRTYVDAESNQTIIQGMGELHLEVYIERMKREYKCEVDTGMPEVAYREAITERAEFNYTHKKQTGGSGQYGRVAGFMEPCADHVYEFVDSIKGGSIPNEYIPSCDKGFKEAVKKGALIHFPVVNIRMTINDGASHAVDSSDIAFQQAALGGFREAYLKAKPVILEPIMKVVAEGPAEFQGNIFASVNQRRGVITASTEEASFCRVEAEVPLSEMFGYSTVLRSMTQGKAEFSMEFLKYGKVPTNISEQLRKDFEEKRKKEHGR
ncbi:MAG: translation elongation factor G [Spirochaetes bacterium GWD1_61_31]|nr:MAG: translation elongation factor G [Spirochaetes bacterium GWB1_60_80]OHD32474.1 MAG: translation elongation factor G [Spirochaetes bacterium GWC1_61_12]OHD42717.1 MAG: translation elongation factor G [Spirochaetes bacterium GWD1_61_31]OHD43744.1 MAG: translation elongation factor G [Spirochaetes bacterium GWE1_60_18]OHD60230.1 MAG: translation elongation factor G [Spirochaetes bacterium GWF1_60_12]HAP44368.1 elongation factor G [Spirochaetaceae bacterium]